MVTEDEMSQLVSQQRRELCSLLRGRNGVRRRGGPDPE